MVVVDCSSTCTIQRHRWQRRWRKLRERAPGFGHPVEAIPEGAPRDEALRQLCENIELVWSMSRDGGKELKLRVDEDALSATPEFGDEAETEAETRMRPWARARARAKAMARRAEVKARTRARKAVPACRRAF